ncbi:hypothetical protein LPB86_20290 [Pedobacter sp. MC2016-14]|uniref:hypothetical protein n=1 Tax=Pedobacter sp. MC2016-14 TaxID=2897327 RepID=UPI001E32C5B2|nr:hypothetical protein [Pedobacter sp. MC2016-14]MCD0490589.1 hypothetical protein [Pedobacter sp. MC2016-14]
METIKINESDVKYCIKKLINYDDCYSNGIVTVFKHYLEHKEFKQMRDDLETVPHGHKALYNLWDVDARIVFLEVIYPS